MGVSYLELARRAGIGCNTLTRLERGEGKALDMVVSRVVRALGPALAEAFPGTTDVFDLLFPPSSFGGWLGNFRLRRGLQQVELARILNVHKVTVWRYEKGDAKPDAAVVRRMKWRFKLDGELDRFFR